MSVYTQTTSKFEILKWFEYISYVSRKPVKTKTAIITGDSSGIGRAIANQMLEEGWRVIGISRYLTEKPIEHEQFFPKKIDMKNLLNLPDKLKLLSEQIAEVDAIVANAGKGQFGHLEEFSYQQIRSLIDLNFLSQVYLIKAFLPAMKRRKTGHVVFIGSEAALSGKKKGSIYCASKFAVRGFCQALRQECAASKIRVTLINPGIVKTNFFNHLNFTPGRESGDYILAQDVAAAALMALQAREGVVFDEINLSPQRERVNKK